MQTELHLTLQSLVVMLPAGIPGCEKQYSVPDQDHVDVDLGKGIVLATPDLELQLRLHEHLMGTGSVDILDLNTTDHHS